MTWHACLTRLWATLFPSLRTWENLIHWKDSVITFTSWIKRPDEATDSESSINYLMSISQSPFKITEFSPSSCANSRALVAASVSVSNAVSGRGIGWDKDAITKPLQSRIMTLYQLCPKKWTMHRQNWFCKTQLAEQTSEPPALVVVAELVGWLSTTPEVHHRHVDAPAQVESQVVRSMTCCA